MSTGFFTTVYAGVTMVVAVYCAWYTRSTIVDICSV